MPMNRRELLRASVAGAAILENGRTAFAAPPANIQVSIDASKPGAPVNPMVFGGYMEPATTRVWAEMLTDRKFFSPIAAAPPPAAPAGPAGGFRRMMGEPFRPVGPAGTVEMDTAKAYVGTHSARVKLAASEPHGISQSRLRVHQGKSYTGRVILAGDSTAKVSVRLVWGPGAADSQTVTISPLTSAFQKFPLKFTPAKDSEDARLEIVGTGSGVFHVGTASLMPGDNMQGFNAGMIKLFKDAGFKMAKWPGGNFVSAYDFRDGLGDIDKRAPKSQPMWSGRAESNNVGLHEYVAFAGCWAPNPTSPSTAASATPTAPPSRWNTATAPPPVTWAPCARGTAAPSHSTSASGPSATKCTAPGSTAACRSTSTGRNTITSSKP